MPAAPTGSGASSDRKKKKKLKKTVAPRGADTGDRARTNPVPSAPPVKQRVFAHPKRKEPAKVLAQDTARAEVEATKRAATRKAVQKIKVTPVASPDARDSTRTLQQRARDTAAADTNIVAARKRGEANRKYAKVGVHLGPDGKLKVADPDKFEEAGRKQTTAAYAPVLRVLEETTRVNHAVAGAADAAVTGKNVPKAALKGIKNETKTTFSDVLGHAGVKNKAVKGVAGFALDVGLDPTTYVTFGTGSVAAKSAAKGAEKAAAETAAKGVTVKFAGKEAPGVRRATAKLGTAGGTATRKVIPEKVRDATRNTVSEVNPAVAPAGVAKETHQAARKAARKARAATTKGEREAINLGHAIKKKVGEKNYARVVDAIEAGDLTALPKELQAHAATVSRHLANIRKVQKDAGVHVPERKGYVPRKLTPETIAAENKRAARVGGSGTTVPGSSKARVEQRPMAEVREESPGRYRQDLHALVAERMAEGTASAARATLEKEIADLGRVVERGSRPHISEREALYKFKDGKLVEVDASGKAFRKKPPDGGTKAKYVILPRKLVERARGSAARPEGGTIMTGYDRVQGGFKKIALATPGFHIRNLIGDTAQAYVHQPGQKLPGNMVRAGRILKAVGRDEKAQRALTPDGKAATKGHGTIKTKHYGHVTYDEAARRLIEAGAARSGYTARELRELGQSGKSKLKLPKSPGGVRRALLNREDLPRLATAIHAVREGATWEQAAAKVADVHFDYADLTPFERNVARRIMPFYTWTARNIPLQSKRIVTNPGKYANYQKVRESATNATQPGEVDEKTQDLYRQLEASGVKLDGGWEKYLTKYEQRNVGVPVSWKGQKFTVSAGLPLGDLNELPGMSGPGEYLNKAASLVTPVVKDPVEFGFNYSFFFRDQIERDNSPLVAAPSPVGKWPEWAKKKFGVVKAQDKRSGKMIWQWPGRADYVAHAVPGLPSQAVKAMTPGHDRQGKGAAAKTLGVLGVKATPVDATTNAINLAYERMAQIQKRQAALRQQGINAKNPNAEYARLSAQLKVTTQIAYQGKEKRHDAVLPKQGGPPKFRRSSSGRVKLGSASRSRVKLGGGSSGPKVRLGG